MARLLEQILPADRLPANYRAADGIPRAAWAAFAREAGARNADAARDAVVDRLLNWHVRGEVAPATTGGDGWADDLAELAVGAFFSSVPGSAAAKLIAAGVRVDIATATRFPRRAAVPTGFGAVDEGAAIRLMAGLLATSNVVPAKLAVIVVASREIAKRLNGQAVIEQMIREEAALALDQYVFGSLGLRSGITPIISSSDPLYDLEMALEAVADAGGSGPVVAITSPGDASKIALGLPGLSVPVWPTRAVARGTIIAVDPSAFVSAFGPEPLLFASGDALVHMDTAPSTDVGGGDPTPIRSTFQTDTLAVRCIVDVGVAMRSDAIAVVA